MTAQFIDDEKNQSSSPFSDFPGSNSEAINARKSLLQQKLKKKDVDGEALKILQRLEWMFIIEKVLTEMDENDGMKKRDY
ncbi:hypothetical protein ACFX13_032435 [Malus domestica]